MSREETETTTETRDGDPSDRRAGSGRPRRLDSSTPRERRDREPDSPNDFEASDLWRILLWGSLVVLSLLAAFSLVQFYTFASAAIDQWAGEQFRAILQAAFNLVVLLVAGAGIAVVVRRLSGDRGSVDG